MSLRAPGRVSTDLLPLGVVEGGIGPGEIVSKVELPLSAEAGDAGAGILDCKGAGESGSGQSQRRENEYQSQGEAEKSGSPVHHSRPPFEGRRTKYANQHTSCRAGSASLSNRWKRRASMLTGAGVADCLSNALDSAFLCGILCLFPSERFKVAIRLLQFLSIDHGF